MDRGKKPSSFFANKNNQIYMDLKDIVRENALRYLPAKSLRRCASVCREWRLFIATPFFAHNQSNFFRDVLGFFCQSPSSLPSFVSLDPVACGVPDPSLKFLPEPVDIRCSSHGLLCCQGRPGYNAYYICNPVTQQWKKLPKPDANHGSDPALVLVFEPSLLNFVADYKLICAFPSDLDGYEFEIYSSSEESWRTSGEIFFSNRQIIPSSGVYVGGIVYWECRNSGIVAFDLKSERSTLIYAYCIGYQSFGSLGEVNGKLCHASMVGPTLTVSELSNSFANTMQMHSNARAWAKTTFTFHDSVFNGVADQRSVLYVGGDVVVIRLGKTLVSHNMKTKEIKQFSTEADYHPRMIPYVNSLVEI